MELIFYGEREQRRNKQIARKLSNSHKCFADNQKDTINSNLGGYFMLDGYGKILLEMVTLKVIIE